MSWWRPLPVSSRHWERSLDASVREAATGLSPVTGAVQQSELPPNVKVLSEEEQQGKMFPHGASPFRTHPDAPPKIDWSHVWGTVKWGKKAGAWGQGSEALEHRKKKDQNDDTAEEEKDNRKDG